MKEVARVLIGDLKVSVTILLFCLCVSCRALCAETLSSKELLSNPNGFDNRQVTYEGEVVGDIMERGRFAWLNTWDGTNAIGIWCKKEMIRDVRYAGRYGSKGDIITVRGIFHKACLSHGGDLDIHAEEVIVHTYGSRITHAVDSDKVRTGIALCGVLVIVSGWWFVFISKRRNERRGK